VSLSPKKTDFFPQKLFDNPLTNGIKGAQYITKQEAKDGDLTKTDGAERGEHQVDSLK
jgi:hypothetical protein